MSLCHIRDEVHLFEQISLNPFVSERWIDVLAENWSDILRNDQLRIHLPKMLNSLGKTIKSKNYLEKMKRLKNLNNGNLTEISDVLDSSVKDAIFNVKWINSIRQEI